MRTVNVQKTYDHKLNAASAAVIDNFLILSTYVIANVCKLFKHTLKEQKCQNRNVNRFNSKPELTESLMEYESILKHAESSALKFGWGETSND